MLIISLIFIAVLSVITYLNIRNVNNNVEKSKNYIRQGLVAKGRTLTSNNSLAMRQMAEENAFNAILSLVSSTVKDDPDIEYGIYMNDMSVAWVHATPENPSGRVREYEPLNDQISNWAVSQKALSYKEWTHNNIIEFAAPVFVGEQIRGFIRYGFNTRSMDQAIEDVLQQGRMMRRQMLLMLAIIGLVSLMLTFLIIRRIAVKITNPIKALVESANAITTGNYNMDVPESGNDEIGELAKHFELMRVTVKKYTDHLQELVDEKMQQVNDILNNIDQGLFTINLDGSVNQEYSARANEILKVKDVAASALDELFRLDPQQEHSFNIWLDLISKKHSKQRWKKLTRLAPIQSLELSNKNNDKDFIAIEYQKIFDKNGLLAKIMILARDETEKRIKELQMMIERRQHEHEVKLILGLVNTPAAELGDFMHDIDERMQRLREILEQFKENPADKIKALYRDIHTIKGNSGSYGFETLSVHAHKAEDALENLCNNQQEVNLNKVRNCLEKMNADIAQIHAKIKLIFGKDEYSFLRIPIPLVENIAEVCTLIDVRTASIPIIELVDKCRKLTWVPIETITRKYQKIVARVARRQNKNIEFSAGPEIYLPANIFADIDDALVHLIQNAATHGIEAPEIRDELDKGMGRISFDFQQDDQNRTITIKDDGQGIDPEQLVHFCVQKNILTQKAADALNRNEKLELIFIPGVSTCVETDILAGRGIGMDVVHEQIKKASGVILIDSKENLGTTITLTLPLKPLLKDMSK